MTVLSGLPYPDAHGWQDLRPYLTNSWGQRGLVTCAFKVDGNDLHLTAGLTLGTARQITSGMPGLPVRNGARIMTGMVIGSAGTDAVQVRWESSGELTLAPDDWGRTSDMNSLIVNGMAPR